MSTIHILSPALAASKVVLTRSPALPQGQLLRADLVSVYQRHLAGLNTKVAAGHIFDGPVTVLRGWSWAAGQLYLELQPSSYVPMTAMRLTYVEALLSGALSESDIASIPSRFGACLCACVSVLTADNQIISLRRSARLSNPGTVALGLGEVLEPADFVSASLPLHRAGARALREELGVTLTEEQTENHVKPMYLARGNDCGTWVFIIVVDLRGAGVEFTARSILAQAESASDSWEAESRQAIAFDSATLHAFLRSHEGRLGLWAPQLVPLLLSDFT